MSSKFRNANDHVKALIYLVITALLWSTGGVLIKLVPVNAMAVAGIRSIIAAAVLMIYIKKPKFNWSFWQIAGAIFYSATVILFVLANQYTTSANAILLQYTSPVYIAVLGIWILKEKPVKQDWITIIIVLAGMVLFFVEDLSIGNKLGNIFAIASGVAFSMMIMSLRRQKDASPIESVLLGNLITFVISIPFLSGISPGLTGWTALFISGCFQLGITYILYAKAIKTVTALEAILVPVIEPILNPIWTFFIIGEAPGIMSAFGGLIIITSVTLRYVLPALKVQKKPA